MKVLVIPGFLAMGSGSSKACKARSRAPEPPGPPFLPPASRAGGFWRRRLWPKIPLVSSTFMTLQRLARIDGRFWLGTEKSGFIGRSLQKGPSEDESRPEGFCL